MPAEKQFASRWEHEQMVRAAGSAEHPRRLTLCPTNHGGAPGEGLFLSRLGGGWMKPSLHAAGETNDSVLSVR